MKDIVFDVDGTLSNNEHRQHHLETKPRNWKLFNETIHLDLPHYDIIWLLNTFRNAGNRIIICTARTSDLRQVTEEWLARYDIKYHAMYMREEKDYRDDGIIKVEMYRQILSDGFDPYLWIDDRKRVVDALRDIGVRVLQVAPGEF